MGKKIIKKAKPVGKKKVKKPLAKKVQSKHHPLHYPTPQAFEAARAATRGKKFWELRSKHGRDKLFASPELMLEAAREYFEWCDENPDHEIKPMVVSNGGNEGSSVEMVKIPKKQPYTMIGLCLYLGCGSSYFRTFKQQLRENDPQADNFRSVIFEIEQTIYKQQYDGAASGFFNANIIARALGLSEKVETDVTDNRKKTSELFPEVLNNSNDTQE